MVITAKTHALAVAEAERRGMLISVLVDRTLREAFQSEAR